MNNYNKIDISALEKSLHYKFRHYKNLELALNHLTNQTLEFLGDTVLQYLITLYLWEHFFKNTEGELTILRSHLVKKSTLVKLACTINLEDHLISTTKITSNMIEDCFEALIAAIYLDGGLKATKEVLLRLYEKNNYLPVNKIDVASIKNYISLLNERITKTYPNADSKDIIKYTKVGKTSDDKFIVTLDILGNHYKVQETSLKKAKLKLSKMALDYLA